MRVGATRPRQASEPTATEGDRERTPSIPPPISLEIPGLDDPPESQDLAPQSGSRSVSSNQGEDDGSSHGGLVEEVTADLTKDPRHER
jgi:hypothetical protein